MRQKMNCSEALTGSFALAVSLYPLGSNVLVDGKAPL